MTETQPRKTNLQNLLTLNDQLAACEADTLAASLMSEDLLNFFEEANHADPADKPIYMIYLPENEVRAHIMQEYTSRAYEQVKKLYQQTLTLIDAMKQEGEAALT